MKTLLLSILVTLLFASCGSGTQKEAAEQKIDTSIVYVYYFHGKQRCKTCVAVENVVKQTIRDTYSGNEKVKFIEVKTDRAENDWLIRRYEITWNALIIAKGNEHTDITKEAFATAVNSPAILAEQTKTEINKFLE